MHTLKSMQSNTANIDNPKRLFEIDVLSKSEKKIKLGQFFTKKNLWLKNQVQEFIKSSNTTIAYDPFAGVGDLLSASLQLGFKKTIGLDIDDKLAWNINDSLKKIPHYDNAIIITNPPYIAKQSASRKNLDLSTYFNESNYDDVYLIALDKMIEAQDYIVAIIPESFINSNYKQKNLINSITILEENPFEDTENPVCVVCFDGKRKSFDQIKVFRGNDYLNTLEYFENLRLEPNNNIKVSFNDKNGWLALRATDSSNGTDIIHFSLKNDMKYDWENRIKISSRHISLLNVDISENDRTHFISIANEMIYNLRKSTSDVILTPFKGNTKQGKRRRRLDFKQARAIIEYAYAKMKGTDTYEQLRFF